jgi:hypothetical protein
MKKYSHVQVPHKVLYLRGQVSFVGSTVCYSFNELSVVIEVMTMMCLFSMPYHMKCGRHRGKMFCAINLATRWR